MNSLLVYVPYLQEFYAPFNAKLAHILKDDRCAMHAGAQEHSCMQARIEAQFEPQKRALKLNLNLKSVKLNSGMSDACCSLCQCASQSFSLYTNALPLFVLPSVYQS